MSDHIIEFPGQSAAGVIGQPANESISPQAMALMETMVTAELLYTYAVQTLQRELPGREAAISTEVKNQLASMTEFNLDILKYRMFDSLQTVMIHIADLYAKAQAMDTANTPDTDPGIIVAP